MNDLKLTRVLVGFAHTGANTVPEFQNRATLWIQSFAGVAEANPHNLYNVRN